MRSPYFGCANLYFVYFYFADPEANADELNHLTISHTAKTISCKNIGRCPISIPDDDADAEKN
jgi:hypothetical protein